MKLKVQFIGSLAMINAYFMGFAYGFNLQHVLVVDESLPPVKPQQIEHRGDSEMKPAKKAIEAESDRSGSKPGSKSGSKRASKNKSQNSGAKSEQSNSPSAKKQKAQQQNKTGRSSKASKSGPSKAKD